MCWGPFIEFSLKAVIDDRSWPWYSLISSYPRSVGSLDNNMLMRLIEVSRIRITATMASVACFFCIIGNPHNIMTYVILI